MLGGPYPIGANGWSALPPDALESIRRSSQDADIAAFLTATSPTPEAAVVLADLIEDGKARAQYSIHLGEVAQEAFEELLKHLPGNGLLGFILRHWNALGFTNLNAIQS